MLNAFARQRVFVAAAVSVASGALMMGCHPLEVAERTGRSGWFMLEGASAIAPYRERLAALPPEWADACRVLERRGAVAGAGPVFITVAGIGGDSPHWQDAIDALEQMSPRAIFLFRWVPYEGLEPLTERFARGVNLITRCLPGAAGRTVVLAHSAGGVVASMAADQLVAADPEHTLTVLTVASPLAGVNEGGERIRGVARPKILFDLGGKIDGYPAADPTVRFVHLRTDPIADGVMRLRPQAHSPNDPRIGVPSAAQLDLPPHLGHVDAFVWVARNLPLPNLLAKLDAEGAQ